jgi:hypothetical protein
MSRQFDLNLEQLRQINAALRQSLELAEARVAQVNELVTRLAASGLLNNRVLLGKIVFQRAYDAAWDDGSWQVIQASLSSSQGFGAIFWDSEQLASLQNTPYLEVEALGLHRPFDQCPPAVKALLLHQIEPLLAELIGLLN